MYCWQSPTTFLYSESLSPKFASQPDIVFSTPGLGHIVQDFALYVPLPNYASSDVKEVEKQLEPSKCTGGLELNPPLIQSYGGRKGYKHQKGKGKPKIAEEDHLVAKALDHPIKVKHIRYLYIYHTASILYVPFR